MKTNLFSIMLISLLALCSCKESTESITVSERRPLTTYDTDSNWHMVIPKEWRRVAGTKFRHFNCKFNNTGEVYFSIASGGVQENAERWLKQFGDQSSIDVTTLEKIPVLGKEGVLVEAQGTYQGMRGITQENAALLGMLVPSHDALITVKMVGNADEVAKERERFITFCKSIKFEKDS